MKQIISLFFVLFSSTVLYCQDSKALKDSLLAKLLPFKLHIENATADLNDEVLITMINKKMDGLKTRAIPYIVKNKKNKSITNEKGLVEYDSIWKYDNYNSAFFYETKFNLSNREELIKYKSVFEKTDGKRKKINAIMNYVVALNETFPNFNNSGTSVKYLGYLNTEIHNIKVNTLKAIFLKNLANLKFTIDKTQYRNEIFQNLLEAEKILLSPYNDERNRYHLTHVYNKQDDSLKYNDYISKKSFSVTLLDIYDDISRILNPRNFSDKNNELFAFRDKAYLYISYGYTIAEILYNCRKISKTSFENWKQKFLFPYTFIEVSSNTKYTDAILQRQILTLSFYSTYLRNDSSSTFFKSNLYFGLSIFFLNNKEPHVALKSFYLGLSLLLKSTDFSEGGSDILDNFFIFLYYSFKVNNSANVISVPENKNLVNIYNAFSVCYKPRAKYFNEDATLLTTMGLMQLFNNEKENSRKTFLDLRQRYSKLFLSNRTAVKDDEILSITGIIYEVLNKKHWLKYDKEEQIEATDTIARIDSIILSGLNSPDAYAYDSRYVSETLSDLEQIESNSWWYHSQAKLEEEIFKLTISRDTLVKSIDDFKVKNDKLYQRNLDLFTAMEIKGREITKLDSLIKKSKNEEKRASSQLKIVNNLLKLTVGFLVVGVFLLIIIIRQKIKQQNKVKSLGTTISNLEKEAEEKDYAKQLTEQTLLSETASHHILLPLISKIPSLLTDAINNPDNRLSVRELNNILEYSSDVHSYFKTDFNLKHSLVNSINDEINFTASYLHAWKKIRREKDPVDFIYDEKELQLIENIKLPKKIVLNFVSNSYRHGRKKGTGIVIQLKVAPIENGYILIIRDNGTGFDNLNRNEDQKYKGINLVTEQIKNYNSNKGNSYFIHFSKQNIENIYENNVKAGVQVTIKLLRNEAQSNRINH